HHQVHHRGRDTQTRSAGTAFPPQCQTAGTAPGLVCRRGTRHGGVRPRGSRARPGHRRAGADRGGGLGDGVAARLSPDGIVPGPSRTRGRGRPHWRLAMNAQNGLDLVTMNVIENTMIAICREMGITLMKTSYSTVFNEALDFTCGLASPQGEMLAVAEFCPAQIGGMPLLIRSCLQEVPLDTIEP